MFFQRWLSFLINNFTTHSLTLIIIALLHSTRLLIVSNWSIPSLAERRKSLANISRNVGTRGVQRGRKKKLRRRRRRGRKNTLILLKRQAGRCTNRQSTTIKSPCVAIGGNRRKSSHGTVSISDKVGSRLLSMLPIPCRFLIYRSTPRQPG